MNIFDDTEYDTPITTQQNGPKTTRRNKDRRSN